MKEILEHINYAKRKNSGVLIIDDEKTIDTIERALEKQIPAKVIEADEPYEYSCINCEGYVLAGWSYCRRCGQRLDWRA